jgi:hypothetical protein
VLSMWPYKKYFSHPSFSYFLLFSNPTHQTGIATRWDWTTSCNPPGSIKLSNQSNMGVSENTMPFYYQPQHHEHKQCRARTILWWAKPACFDCSSSNFLEMGGYIIFRGVEVLGCQGWGLLAECVCGKVIISRWIGERGEHRCAQQQTKL